MTTGQKTVDSNKYPCKMKNSVDPDQLVSQESVDLDAKFSK